MASHAPRLLALNLPAAFLALSLWAPSAHAQLVDGRRSLPLFPATSWKDGFFLEHSAIADLGFHARVSTAYIQSPFGAQANIDNRLALYVGGVLSLMKYVDFGVVLPIAVWQSGAGTNLTTSALGDLRLLGKVRVPVLGEKGLPVLAFSLAVAFPTGTTLSSFSAQAYTYIPKVIIDWQGLKGRLHVGANVSAVLSGTGEPCNPLTQPLGTDGKPTACPMYDPGAVVGLGNHFYYGVGASALVGPKSGLSLTTELIGSFAYNGSGTQSPLLWDVGVQKLVGNGFTLAGMYGRGLTAGSPANVVMVQIGYAFEVEDKKKEEGPKLEVELTVKNEMLPAPAATPVTTTPPPSSEPPPPSPPVDELPPWQGPPPPPYVDPSAPQKAPAQKAAPTQKAAPPAQKAAPPQQAAPTPPKAAPSARKPSMTATPGKTTTTSIEIPKDWMPPPAK